MGIHRNKTDGIGRKLRRTTSTSRALAIALAAAAFSPATALADENGVSLWVPGLYGSLAAVPATPGASIATVYYHTSVSASGAVAASRQITVGRFNRTATVDLNATVNADVDLLFLVPSYVFQSPVLGGQLAVSMAGLYGRNKTSLDGNLSVGIGSLTATRFGSFSDTVTGAGDLYPQFTLKWNRGVHNYMVYGFGDIPVGAYEPGRLANLGIGHGGIDGGFGYTYFDPTKGHEFSFVTGLTYNFKNTDTDYRNGIDWHLDWGASQFLSKQVFVGAVGYFYNQLTNDTGGAEFLGGFKSRVIGAGPQIGYIFPVGGMQGFLGAKAYFEFDAKNRPDGWNGWLTFSLSPAAPQAAPVTAQRRPMVYK